MRIIPTKIHAMMDYLSAALLIGVPMFWLDVGGPAVWVPIAVGLVVLLQSLFTDYEISLSNAIPMPAHLMMDGIAGLVLAASPWLFGFHELVWLPHLLVGLAEIGGAILSKTHRDEPAHVRAPTGKPRATA